MIEVSGITVRAGKTARIENIGFTVEKGRALAIVGEKGAGKTTLMDAVTGVIDADAGTVKIAGVDMAQTPYQAKAHLGYAPAVAPLYPDMSPRAYLKFVGETREIPTRALNERVGAALQALHIGAPEADEPIRFLSESIKRRLNAAQAILAEPDVLAVDGDDQETDPQTECVLRALYKTYAENHTVVLATDNLTEACMCADSVLVLSEGRVAAFGTPGELSRMARRDGLLRVTVRGACDACEKALEKVDGVTVESCQTEDDGAHLTLNQNGRDLRAEISTALGAEGLAVLEMTGVPGGLETLLMKLRTDSRAAAKEDTADEERV